MFNNFLWLKLCNFLITHWFVQVQVPTVTTRQWLTWWVEGSGEQSRPPAMRTAGTRAGTGVRVLGWRHNVEDAARERHRPDQDTDPREVTLTTAMPDL